MSLLTVSPRRLGRANPSEPATRGASKSRPAGCQNSALVALELLQVERPDQEDGRLGPGQFGIRAVIAAAAAVGNTVCLQRLDLPVQHVGSGDVAKGRGGGFTSGHSAERTMNAAMWDRLTGQLGQNNLGSFLHPLVIPFA